jgi:hypothetical protein
MVSDDDVFEPIVPKKKRGRKPKTSTGEYLAPKAPNLTPKRTPKHITPVSTQYPAKEIPTAKVIDPDIISATPLKLSSTVSGSKQPINPNVPAITIGDNTASVLQNYFALKRIEQVEAHKTRLELIGQEAEEQTSTDMVNTASQAAAHKLDSSNQEHRRNEQV